MKVDMSPEAVSARLRIMNDLWLLSIKLVNNQSIVEAEDITDDEDQPTSEKACDLDGQS